MTPHPLLDTARTIDANTGILDRQVVDADGLPVCKVDDLTVEQDAAGDWVVTAILLGPGALGPRLGGRLGATLAGINRRLRAMGEPHPPQIPWHLVSTLGSDVRLRVTRPQLPPHLTPLEDWLHEHVIARIPGNGHADR
jgi:hypothetical protein